MQRCEIQTLNDQFPGTRMLTRLSIKNFRCFENVEVELKPLTVLIGPNNTGKSSFLSAIQLLGTGQSRRSYTIMDHYRLEKESVIEISGAPEYGSRRFSKDSNDRRRMDFVEESLPNGIEFYRLPSSGAACRSEGFPDSSQAIPLNEDGSNLAAVLDFMLRKDRKRFLGLVAALEKLIPGFEDLMIDTPDANTRHLRLKLDNGLELPGESLSSGVRHLIFFATLAYHPRAPQIILIEEPEVGVHPKRLKEIMELLRSISQGEHCSPAAQVILTTHSPFLLDHVNLDTDQVLTFRRSEEAEGKRVIEPVDKQRLSVFLDEFMLGEVWFNQLEEGLVGKVKA
jgi:predicted ATPase